MEKIINKIAQELNVKSTQVENAVKLIDDGNTIPFIARYRKEATGGLSDEILRDLGERLNYLRNLETRKGEVVNSINEQGKLTDELTIAIASAETLAEVEDLYRPFKQKKKTRATVAKAKGLEPLSEIIIAQEEKTPIEELASKYINIDSLSEEDKTNKDKVVATAEDAIQGALDIIAENISDNAKYRKYIKKVCYHEGSIVTKASNPEEKSNYEMYYDFTELVCKLPSHRILAINRGEKEDCLKVSINKPEEKILYYIQRDTEERVSNVVMMGTGEPMDNYDNVLRFLELITSENGLNISQRNITASTCGIVPNIRRLAEEKLQITLSVSLHAPDDETRSSIMPVNDAYPVERLMKACRYYFDTTGRRISYEYMMARDKTDRSWQADLLAKLLKGRPAHVNLIPVNPVKERGFKRGSRQRIEAFQKALEKRGVNATIRRELGADINAACGQLRREYDQQSGQVREEEEK